MIDCGRRYGTSDCFSSYSSFEQGFRVWEAGYLSIVLVGFVGTVLRLLFEALEDLLEEAVDLGGGARIEVIGPDGALGAGADPNDASTVLRLVMGEVSFLLTGDIEADGEAALVRPGVELRATVLKVAHHGSSTSTTAAFLSRAAPVVGVISVGASNSHGHPTAAVLSRLSEGYVLRTDEDGDVRMETDGERLWVTTER